MQPVSVQKSGGQKPDVFLTALDGAYLEFVLLKYFYILKSNVADDARNGDDYDENDVHYIDFY